MPRPLSLSRHAATVSRSLLVTVETVGFATYVHSTAGGRFPGWAPTSALAAVVFVAALALMNRKARFPAIAAGVLGFQVVLHETFSALTADSGASGHDAMAGMAMSALPADGAATHPLGSMLLSHLVIGILTLLVLASQGQALDALGSLTRILAGPRVQALRPAMPRIPRRGPAVRTALLSIAPRRGPPSRVLLTP